VMAPRTLVL
nr:Chain C, leader peptide of HLA class I histocompatibility antigen, A alpha chain [Homo sapiens]5W1W_H Chain H, leader peptide of HLA class I histocompatibility antigen, A alpha chain [Homo sapiens]5W1W_M Chain M, leader peptide of HLA class I histocompatibility antigen, A alpha chain [Homo sapiens]5W1W_R Chain R, leader peptide of HLA class I histocompatibility antigen, A alpha chain [Homo sapiens]